jgi:hypothetical protein
VPNVISAGPGGSRFSSKSLSQRVIGPAGRKDGGSDAPEAPRCAAGRGIVAALTEEPGSSHPTSYLLGGRLGLEKFPCYRRSSVKTALRIASQAPPHVYFKGIRMGRTVPKTEADASEVARLLHRFLICENYRGENPNFETTPERY